MSIGSHPTASSTFHPSAPTELGRKPQEQEEGMNHTPSPSLFKRSPFCSKSSSSLSFFHSLEPIHSLQHYLHTIAASSTNTPSITAYCNQHQTEPRSTRLSFSPLHAHSISHSSCSSQQPASPSRQQPSSYPSTSKPSSLSPTTPSMTSLSASPRTLPGPVMAPYATPSPVFLHCFPSLQLQIVYCTDVISTLSASHHQADGREPGVP